MPISEGYCPCCKKYWTFPLDNDEVAYCSLCKSKWKIEVIQRHGNYPKERYKIIENNYIPLWKRISKI